MDEPLNLEIRARYGLKVTSFVESGRRVLQVHTGSRTMRTSNGKSYFSPFVPDAVENVIFLAYSGHDIWKGLWLVLHAAVSGSLVHPRVRAGV